MFFKRSTNRHGQYPLAQRSQRREQAESSALLPPALQRPEDMTARIAALESEAKRIETISMAWDEVATAYEQAGDEWQEIVATWEKEGWHTRSVEAHKKHVAIRNKVVEV